MLSTKVKQVQQTIRAMATYASCGKVNLPPSSIAGVDKASVFAATNEMISCRSGSFLSLSRTVIDPVDRRFLARHATCNSEHTWVEVEA